MITKQQAIIDLIPNIEFKFEGNHFEALNGWELPSESAIQERMAELQADYDSKQYQRDRAAAYPSWQDQLDNIFHNGIDAWKVDIQAIKDQFPKP